MDTFFVHYARDKEETRPLVRALGDSHSRFDREPRQLHEFGQVLLEYEPELLSGLELTYFCSYLIAQANIATISDQVFKPRHGR